MARNKIMYWLGLSMVAMFTLHACTPVTPQEGPTSEQPVTQTENNASEDLDTLEPTELPAPTETDVPTLHEADSDPDCEDPFGDSVVRFRTEHWEKTDFCLHSVDYGEFLSGGPPPDGIPAIDEPDFESVEEARTWLGESWPVMFFEHAGDARAYPLAILMWHEIVNDVVGGKPVSLTFCPLCNATVVFDRTLSDGTVLDFGTSGNLRNSDLVMYDRQTQSWWQQFTGEAVVGTYTGTTLTMLPSQIIAWSEFAETHPDGLVLSRNTGHVRNYGRNPYVGYDDINNNPFLFTGVLDGRLPATARVVAVEIGDVWKAYPFSELENAGVVNDSVNGIEIVIFWKSGTVSALDQASYDESRDVGSTSIFSRELDGQVLTFEPSGENFKDVETGSTWSIFGTAIEGPKAGTQLEQIVSAEHVWFAWAAFRPDTLIWEQ